MMSKHIHVKCLVCVSPAGSYYYSGASGLLSQISLSFLLPGRSLF